MEVRVNASRLQSQFGGQSGQLTKISNPLDPLKRSLPAKRGSALQRWQAKRRLATIAQAV